MQWYVLNKILPTTYECYVLTVLVISNIWAGAKAQAIEAVCMIEAAKIAQEINTERQEAAAQEIHTRLYNQTPAQYPAPSMYQLRGGVHAFNVE